MVTKRVRLLQTLRTFHMEHLSKKQVYDKDFNGLAIVVRDLNKRIKKAQRKKVEVKQLSFVEKYRVKFVKPRRKRVIEEIIEATSTKETRKIIKQRYGKKTIIKSVRRGN